MKKMPKFLVCENRKAQPGKLFLFHTQTPKFVGKILFLDKPEELDEFMQNFPPDAFYVSGNPLYAYTSDRRGRKIVLVYILEMFDTPTELEGLLKRVEDWLLSYY